MGPRQPSSHLVSPEERWLIPFSVGAKERPAHKLLLGRDWVWRTDISGVNYVQGLLLMSGEGRPYLSRELLLLTLMKEDRRSNSILHTSHVHYL